MKTRIAKYCDSLNKNGPLKPEELWNYLIHNGFEGRFLSVDDLKVFWFGERELSGEEKNQFRVVLDYEGRPYFEPKYNDINIFKVLTEEEHLDLITPKKVEQNIAMIVAEAFLKDYGLYKCGVNPNIGTLILRFVHPKQAERCRDKIEELKKITLWDVEIATTINTAYIDNYIVSWFNEKNIPLKTNPSHQLDMVVVKIEWEVFNGHREEILKFKTKFEEKFCYAINFKGQ